MRVGQKSGKLRPDTQNQVVDFILADPALRAAIAVPIRNRRRRCRGDGCSFDGAYRRIRDYLRTVLDDPVLNRTE